MFIEVNYNVDVAINSREIVKLILFHIHLSLKSGVYDVISVYAAYNI